MPPALAAWSLNHCSTREVPCLEIINNFLSNRAQQFYFALEPTNYTAGHVGERRDLCKSHSQSGGQPRAPDLQARVLAHTCVPLPSLRSLVLGGLTVS